MNKKVIIASLFWILAVLIFILISVLDFSKNTPVLTVNQDHITVDSSTLPQIRHLWRDISEILNQENYERIGINPEEYEEFVDFLEDFASFDGVLVDPINEKFSVAHVLENGNTLYIPFEFQRNAEVFDNDVNKNLAILDIYYWYTQGLVFGWYNSAREGHRILYERDLRHPLHDSVLDVLWWNLNVFDMVSELQSSPNIGKENMELLSYLLEFTWDYSWAQEQRDMLCNQFEACDLVTLTFEWTVRDGFGIPLSWVNITSLNTNQQVQTDNSGNFSISLEVSKFSHQRFKASLTNYSDGFSTYALDTPFLNLDERTIRADFTLFEANDTVMINNENINDYQLWAYYRVDVYNSTYFIPRNWLFFEDGVKFSGDNVTIHTYQFNRNQDTSNLLDNDTFEPVYGYLGNTMVTFGMPYIQIIDNDTWRELFTRSDDPMILQNQVYHMEELFSDADWLYWAIRQEDLDYLYEISNSSENPYPIDFDFLTSNDFLRWPAWWSLDRSTWIWHNVWHRLLDTEGKVELPFYHIK